MSKVELTSKEIEDSQYFIKGAKKPELLVLVEDEQDIPFWDKMFGCVSDKYFRIHIHSLQTAPLQSNKGGKRLIGTGKENLMNVNPDTLGKSKMIAVDADYDLLIDDYHLYTKRLREGNFIVHTEYYAIENHLIDKNTLRTLDIWKRIGLDNVEHPWEDVLNSFGEAVCHSVKLCIASDTHRIPELKVGCSLSPKLSIDTVRSEVKKLSFNPSTYKEDNSNWKTSIEATYSGLDEICSKELTKVDAEIADADILHYLQGHTLYDYVEKVVRHYFSIDYKVAEDKCKNALVGSDGMTIGNAIADLKRSIWQGKQDCVHDSIYNANAIDLADSGIVGIQNQIEAQIN